MASFNTSPLNNRVKVNTVCITNLPLDTKTFVVLIEGKPGVVCPYCGKEKKLTKDQIDLVKNFGAIKIKCSCQYKYNRNCENQRTKSKTFTAYKQPC